mgnify:FL=1
MTAPRIRLVGWNVQPVIMIDDGENLTPTQIAPQMIPAAGWQAFKDGGDAEALAACQAQVDEAARVQIDPDHPWMGYDPNPD